MGSSKTFKEQSCFRTHSVCCPLAEVFPYWNLGICNTWPVAMGAVYSVFAAENYHKIEQMEGVWEEVRNDESLINSVWGYFLGGSETLNIAFEKGTKVIAVTNEKNGRFRTKVDMQIISLNNPDVKIMGNGIEQTDGENSRRWSLVEANKLELTTQKQGRSR